MADDDNGETMNVSDSGRIDGDDKTEEGTQGAMMDHGDTLDEFLRDLGDDGSANAGAYTPDQRHAVEHFNKNLPMIVELAIDDNDHSGHPLIQELEYMLAKAFGGHETQEHHPEQHDAEQADKEPSLSKVAGPAQMAPGQMAPIMNGIATPNPQTQGQGYAQAPMHPNVSGGPCPLCGGAHDQTIHGQADPTQMQNQIGAGGIPMQANLLDRIAARKPKMCPYHNDVVDYSLTLGDPTLAITSLQPNSYGTQYCKSGEYDGKCNFRADMVKQEYWDNKDAEYAQRAEQRKLEQQQQQTPWQVGDITPDDAQTIFNGEPTLELLDAPGDGYSPTADGQGTAVGTPSDMAMAASVRTAIGEPSPGFAPEADPVPTSGPEAPPQPGEMDPGAGGGQPLDPQLLEQALAKRGIDPQTIQEVIAEVAGGGQEDDGSDYWADRSMGAHPDHDPAEDPFAVWPGRHPMGKTAVDYDHHSPAPAHGRTPSEEVHHHVVPGPDSAIDTGVDWMTEDGQKLQRGHTYEMASDSYGGIPERVTIDGIKPTELLVTIHSQGGGNIGNPNITLDVPDKITKEEFDNDKLRFIPVDQGEPTQQQDFGSGEGQAELDPTQQTDLSTPTSPVSHSDEPVDGLIYTDQASGEPVSYMEYAASLRAKTPPHLAWLWDNVQQDVQVSERKQSILQMTAGKNFTTQEQREFINEQGEARNKDKLDLDGTHYIEEHDFDAESIFGG